MKITKQNKNLLISFSSIMLFVVLLFFAYSATGLAGATIAEHMVLPLSYPLLCIASIGLGIMCGFLRNILLFRLPISFCFGIAVGMMLQPTLHADWMIQSTLIMAVVLWGVSLLLLLPLRYVALCSIVLVLGMSLSYFLPLTSNATEYVFFAIYGVCVTVMLIIACGVCISISLSGISLKISLKQFESIIPKQPAQFFSLFL